MYFEIIGDIEEIESIAIGGRIRDIMRIRQQYGHRADGVNSRVWQWFVFRVEEFAKPRSTGMKPMA